MIDFGLIGNITRQYTVWCGICQNWHQTGTRNTVVEAAKEFRWHGWKKTKERGWLCPKCQEAVRQPVRQGGKR